MRTSEETTKIIPALIKAQQSINPIKKDRENTFASSRYATLDAILEEVLPKLNEQGIMLTQEPITSLDSDVRIGVITKLIHSSGEYIEYEPLFMQLEKGAKMNMAQSAGSVITYAKRYAISAILGISTDEDNDGVQPNSSRQSKRQPERNQAYKEQNNQRDQFEGNKKEIMNRLKALSDKTGESVQKLLDFAIKKANENLNQNHEELNSRNIGQIIGVVQVLEAKARKHQQASSKPEQKEERDENQQESLFEGRTVTPRGE